MNLKFNLIKVIVSVIAGIVANFLLCLTAGVECYCVEGIACNCPAPVWFEVAFNPVPIIISLVVIVIAYLVLSVFQKK